MADDKKYYWLKLKRDFFKRHDIRIIEEMPNGKDYILFYLKLLCESVDHEGRLRFSDNIPYSDVMLSTITNTNVDIVRNAIKAFTELQMMDIFDDGTFFMNEVENMIGYETKFAEQKRLYREKQKALTDNNETMSRQKKTMSDKSKSIELEIDKEIDNKGVTRPVDATPQKRFVKPSFDEVQAYCLSRGNKVDLTRFYEYYESNGWSVGRGKMKDWKAAIRYWETDEKKARSFSERKGSFFAPTGYEDEYARVNAEAIHRTMTPVSDDDVTEDDLLSLGIGSALRGDT